MAQQFNKFNNYIDALHKGQVNLSQDAVKVMLTNTAPVATQSKYSDVSGSELVNGNGYTTGGTAIPNVGLTNNQGVESLNAGSTTFTSSTGNMGPFRYAIVYDFTTGVLIGFYDYGQSVTLNGANGETFLVSPTGGAIYTMQ